MTVFHVSITIHILVAKILRKNWHLYNKIKIYTRSSNFGSKVSNNIQNLPPCLRITVPVIVTLFVGSSVKDFHKNLLESCCRSAVGGKKEKKQREKLEPSQYVLFTDVVRTIKLGKMDVGWPCNAYGEITFV
jgi:hypothetical protein